MTNYYANNNHRGAVTSSTGLFTMSAEPQPTKVYSSTGLFTMETRSFGKWGRRLLTGAALLGGAALANHAMGDPWGIGAKVGEGLSNIGNKIGGYFGGGAANKGAEAANADAQPTTPSKQPTEEEKEATRKAAAEAEEKKKQTEYQDRLSSFSQRVDAVLKKIDYIHPTPINYQNYLKEIDALLQEGYSFKSEDRFDGRAIGGGKIPGLGWKMPVIAKWGGEVQKKILELQAAKADVEARLQRFDEVQTQATRDASADLSQNWIARQYPSYENQYTIYKQQWDAHKAGTAVIPPKEKGKFSEKILQWRNAVASKATELNASGKLSAATKMNALYNQLNSLYGEVTRSGI